MSTNYVAEFYKTSTHNYETFFNGNVLSDKITKINKEILNLNKQIEAKKEELSQLYVLRYNDQFTPIEGNFILQYIPKNNAGPEEDFDLFTGTPVDLDNLSAPVHSILVSRKTGEFTVICGYSLPLASIVSRHYNYKITTNNSHCVFTLVKESLIPILDYDSPIITEKGVETRREYTQDATDFIRKMYGLENFNLSLSIKDFCYYLKNNKSTEIILKTAPVDAMKTLLQYQTDKAEPIYKLIGITKNEYDELIEKNLLNDFLLVKETIKDALTKTVNNGLMEENFFHYTNKEWIDIIEKSLYWKDECQFNQVQLDGEINPLYLCLKAYLRCCWGFNAAIFYKYYTFGKFFDYVCEESCNQGYQRLREFLAELKDYLSMCEQMEVLPALYTSYLKQTHDILARNYKVKLTEEQEELFKKQYEDFKDYKTLDGKYVITHPYNAEDVKQEGYSLNHCCASYLNKILQGTSKLVFLRWAKTPAKSLVTIEICNKAIVQARGASNRSITTDEFKAICEYAKIKGLKVNVAPRN